ncbi:hypothetical protein [Microbacterium telephonicum]|uniref:Uncharacterized protein n=1 Tax=Microbacterium telephonicum TaxID=1714841 RepID=A0A498CC31_9MICO|nr:hypothetical protein [Microbacterium telephonicum]RLK52973.1 hypothetical protein C7474_0935 [Microbacterium telephonicum]
MDRIATSTQRTYRYLRLAIAGSVVAVFTSVLVAMPVVGLLPSISHYYYTPARTIFVGAVILVAVGFFALSGRGPERVLLDVAAVIAPLVAIIPTVISPNSVPGLDSTCDDGRATCIPVAFDADVDNGVATFLIVGVVVLVVAVALAMAGEASRPGTALSASIAAVLLAAVWLSWWLAHDWFLQWAHVAAAVGFFVVIAAVAVVNAVRPSDGPKPPRWLQVAYVVIAVALGVTVVGMPLYGSLHVGDVFGVFVGEVAALLLFFAFWVLQSVQYWREPDPALR